MDEEDDFTPKLGKSRSRDGKKIVHYGTRIGRGGSVGRLLSSRDRLVGFGARQRS